MSEYNLESINYIYVYNNEYIPKRMTRLSKYVSLLWIYGSKIMLLIQTRVGEARGVIEARGNATSAHFSQAKLYS